MFLLPSVACSWPMKTRDVMFQLKHGSQLGLCSGNVSLPVSTVSVYNPH